MSRHSIGSVLGSRLLWSALAIAGVVGLVVAQDKAPAAGAPPKVNRYIGAEACKSCHSADATGNQHGTWLKTGHAKAFTSLGTDEAKKFAKDKGIEDAQKSDACLKCHQTAFGVPAEQIKKGFITTAGVQCESCHGPGEMHFKARFAAAAKAAGDDKKAEAYQPVPAGEIIVNPEQKTCLGCHNDQSPTFKPFCYYERVDKIRHDDPRKPRVKDDQLVCGCGEKCPCTKGCEEGKCAVKAKDKGKAKEGDKK